MSFWWVFRQVSRRNSVEFLCSFFWFFEWEMACFCRPSVAEGKIVFAHYLGTRTMDKHCWFWFIFCDFILVKKWWIFDKFWWFDMACAWPYFVGSLWWVEWWKFSCGELFMCMILLHDFITFISSYLPYFMPFLPC